MLSQPTENIMPRKKSTTTTKRKPRGGLAAQLQEQSPAQEQEKSTTKKTKAGAKTRAKLFESSVVRVVMAVGKAGGTLEQAKAGLAKHGITLADTTIRQNLRLGASGDEKWKGPELTKAQLEDFGL